jgi:hypothetical protein
MKNGLPSSLLMPVVLSLIFFACTKPHIHKLTTANTDTPESRELFGCRVNGIVFNPHSIGQTSLGICYYIPVYTGDAGKVFQISGDRQESVCRNFSVSITLDSIQLQEGKTYVLGNNGDQKKFGKYLILKDCTAPPIELFTSDNDPGEITITRFVPEKGIVRGTFAFVVRDDNGNVYRISDGIFDRHFIN